MDAKVAAKERFPKDSIAEDAYRHFSWNHIAARDIGVDKEEIGTHNHEWGVLITDPILNFYKNKYYEYLDDGYSERSAADRAYGRAVTEIPIMKSQLITIFKAKFSTFEGYLEDSFIMDFTNNHYGRDYSSRYADYDTAFTKAKSNLILSEKSVTRSDYKKVWENRWYY
ncbi:hypothetical protein [uncultured Brevibacillus sp.]|uniref:hypothetical protein n=1 Tax=uncultured Brevibacillus sp. TaxID=169970 RepID=UPI002595C208|nr:hypothetical protein [uncultured Brevibacillus sp.]